MHTVKGWKLSDSKKGKFFNLLSMYMKNRVRTVWGRKKRKKNEDEWEKESWNKGNDVVKC